MPRDLLAVFNFTRYLSSTRFRNSAVNAFEPWNEGDIVNFGGQTTDQRASYQKAAFLGFKSGAAAAAAAAAASGSVRNRPNSAPASAGGGAQLVCNNVIAGPGSDVVDNVTTQNGLAAYMESYNIHTYSNMETYTEQFAPARTAASDASRPLWLTECGIHLPAASPAPWSDLSIEDDARQAAFVAPSYAVSMFAGVKLHFFFVLSNYLERGLQFGLLRHTRTPRPAYSALAAVGHFFANSTMLGAVSITSSRAASIPPPSGDLRPATQRSGSSPPPLPPQLEASAYVLNSQPGGGADRLVVVVFCPVPQKYPLPPPSTCTTPAALRTPDVLQAAAVFDYLGRDLNSSVPETVTNTCIFVVLPVGSSIGTLIPPAQMAAAVAPPSANQAAPGPAPTMLASPPAPAPAPAPPPAPPAVVLQSAFDYDGATLSDDVHSLNATVGASTTVAFYVYNFGSMAKTGSVAAILSGGAKLTPLRTSAAPWHNLTVLPMQRARLTAALSPPTGRGWLDGTYGGVTLTGMFGEPDPALLYFRVGPDVATLKPAEEIQVAGSTMASKWTHNIAPGGKVDIEAVGSSAGRGECIQFTMNFSSSVTDCWAFPQLIFQNKSAGSRPGSAMDGVRFALEGLRTLPPVPQAGLPYYSVIFFTGAGTQYITPLTASPTASEPQEATVLFKDAKYGGNGTYQVLAFAVVVCANFASAAGWFLWPEESVSTAHITCRSAKRVCRHHTFLVVAQRECVGTIHSLL